MSISLGNISSIAASEKLTQRQKVEVAESLEAVFTSMLIKEMRNTLEQGFFGEEKSDVLGGMFDTFMGEAMSESMSDSNGLGIKQLVLSQIEKAATLATNASQPTSRPTDAREDRNSVMLPVGPT